MTDFLIKQTFINSETEEILVSQNIREFAPTSEVKDAVSEAVAKSQANAPEPSVE